MKYLRKNDPRRENGSNNARRPLVRFFFFRILLILTMLLKERRGLDWTATTNFAKGTGVDGLESQVMPFFILFSTLIVFFRCCLMTTTCHPISFANARWVTLKTATASQPRSPLPARWTRMDGAGDAPYHEDSERPRDVDDNVSWAVDKFFSLFLVTNNIL
jgi:hypothetical protein